MRLARGAIGRGELVVIPTDTVYGVAADAFSPRRAAPPRGEGAQPHRRRRPCSSRTSPRSTRSPPRCPSRCAAGRGILAGRAHVILHAQPSLHGTSARRAARSPCACRQPDRPRAPVRDGPLAVSSANLTGTAVAATRPTPRRCSASGHRLPRRGGRRGLRGHGERPGDASSTIVDATGLVADGGVRIVRAGVISRERMRRRARGASWRAQRPTARRHPATTGHPRRCASRRCGTRSDAASADAPHDPLPRARPVTALVTFGGSVLVWKLSLKYKLYPGIRERDVHTRPTPRLGGIAMFLGILAAIARGRSRRRWVDRFSIVSIIFQTRRMLAILGAALPHRAHRRRRRHLGPRLDDQAGRAVHRRRAHRLAGRADRLAADRRPHGRLVLDERHLTVFTDRARDERHQLHRRPRRAGRGRRAHRQRRVLRSTPTCWCRTIGAAQLLQPRLAARRRARRGVRRVPAAQLAPGEAVHGRRRGPAHRPAHGHVRDRGHRPDRSGLARHSTTLLPPRSSRSSCRSRCSCPAARLRARRGPPAARREVAVLAPTASTCTTGCSTWATRTCTPC